MFDDEDDLDDDHEGCNGDRGYFVIGFTWKQVNPGQWERRMVRQCGACGSYTFVPIVYMDPSYLWCYSCLSQAVELLELRDGIPKWRCQDCNHVSWDTHLDELSVEGA